MFDFTFHASTSEMAGNSENQKDSNHTVRFFHTVRNVNSQYYMHFSDDFSQRNKH